MTSSVVAPAALGSANGCEGQLTITVEDRLETEKRLSRLSPDELTTLLIGWAHRGGSLDANGLRSENQTTAIEFLKSYPAFSGLKLPVNTNMLANEITSRAKHAKREWSAYLLKILFDPLRTSKKARTPLRRDQIAAGLHLIWSNGGEVHPSPMFRKAQPEFSKKLGEALLGPDFELPTYLLLKSALTYSDDWGEWYAEAKIPWQRLESAEIPWRWIPKKDLLGLLRYLDRNNLPLLEANLMEDRGGDLALLFKEYFDLDREQAMTGTQLVRGISGRFNEMKWDRILRLAKIPLKSVRESSDKLFLTKTQVLRTLQSANSHGWEMNSLAWQTTHESEEERSLLRSWAGFKERLIHRRNLFYAATKHFGSWDRALTKAGLNPKAVRRTNPLRWSPALILEVLQKAHQAKWPLNASGLIFSNQTEHASQLAQWMGQPGEVIHPRLLYKAASAHFGSLSLALERAGIKSSAIRRAYHLTPPKFNRGRRAAAHRASVEVRVEFSKDASGAGLVSAYFRGGKGRDLEGTKHSDDADWLAHVHMAIEKIPKADQEVVKAALAVLSQSGKAPKRVELAAEVSKELGEEIDAETLEAIFASLSERTDFRELDEGD